MPRFTNSTPRRESRPPLMSGTSITFLRAPFSFTQRGPQEQVQLSPHGALNYMVIAYMIRFPHLHLPQRVGRVWKYKLCFFFPGFLFHIYSFTRILSFVNGERKIILHTVFLHPFPFHLKKNKNMCVCFATSRFSARLRGDILILKREKEHQDIFYSYIRLHCMLGCPYVPASYFASFHYHAMLRRWYFRFIKREGTLRYFYNNIRLHCKPRYRYVTVLSCFFFLFLHFLSFNFLSRSLVMPQRCSAELVYTGKEYVCGFTVWWSAYSFTSR